MKKKTEKSTVNFQELIEKTIILKNKIKSVINYIGDNNLPLNLKLEIDFNKVSEDLNCQKYLLHSISNFNLIDSLKKLKVEQKDFEKFNFLEPISAVENIIFTELYKSGKIN